jgi:hypothetical protein
MATGPEPPDRVTVDRWMSAAPILLSLDLDETLVHATRVPLATPASFFQVGPYAVYRRPGLEARLASMTPA